MNKNWEKHEMRRKILERENGMQPDDSGSSESDTLTIEMPLDGFTDESIANLEKLIASKANLIKKAIGVDDLPLVRSETTLQFPWFSFHSSLEEVTAYSRFVVALCNAAKKQKRVSARKKEVENEKYEFRMFLLRLGFGGIDFKNVRRILLRKFDDNSVYARNQSESEGTHE